VLFLQFSAAAHILAVNCAESLEIYADSLRIKFLAQNVHF